MMGSEMMDESDYDRAEYCRAFLRGWCRARYESSFKVVDGYRRPRLSKEDGREVVVVGSEWLAANAIPPEYLAEERRGG